MNDVGLMKLLLAPVETEKAHSASEKGHFVTFKVLKSADKAEIKTAVERLFEVEVASVRTVNVKGKVRRFGRREGHTKDWKKAYVQLKPGFDIQFSEGE